MGKSYHNRRHNRPQQQDISQGRQDYVQDEIQQLEAALNQKKNILRDIKSQARKTRSRSRSPNHTRSNSSSLKSKGRSVTSAKAGEKALLGDLRHGLREKARARSHNSSQPRNNSSGGRSNLQLQEHKEVLKEVLTEVIGSKRERSVSKVSERSSRSRKKAKRESISRSPSFSNNSHCSSNNSSRSQSITEVDHHQEETASVRSVSPSDRDHRRTSSSVSAPYRPATTPTPPPVLPNPPFSQQEGWERLNWLTSEDLKSLTPASQEIAHCQRALNQANPFEILYLYQTLVFWRRLIRCYGNPTKELQRPNATAQQQQQPQQPQHTPQQGEQQ